MLEYSRALELLDATPLIPQLPAIEGNLLESLNLAASARLRPDGHKLLGESAIVGAVLTERGRLTMDASFTQVGPDSLYYLAGGVRSFSATLASAANAAEPDDRIEFAQQASLILSAVHSALNGVIDRN
jgi:hypothetical protein